MFDEVFPLTGQHVDDRKLYHGVTSGLLAHAGACHVDQYLCGERRVVDAHAELHALVLRVATHSLAHQVYAVTHVTHRVDRLNGHDVRFVVCEIGVSFDFLGHLIERGTVFQLHIYHASVDALTQRNGHRQRILHALLASGAHAVSHRHAWSEVGVAKAFGCQALHQRAHNGVGSRVPSRTNDAHRMVLLAQGH